MEVLELREIKKWADAAIQKHKELYKNRLNQLLDECGMYGRDVQTEYYGEILIGRIIAESLGSLFEYPELVFHHYTKSGTLSTHSRFSVNIWDDDTDAEVKRKLRNLFTVIEKEKPQKEVPEFTSKVPVTEDKTISKIERTNGLAIF